MIDSELLGAALYGEVDNSSVSWARWLDDALDIAGVFARVVTHVDARGDSFRSGKILTLARARKRLEAAMSRQESFEWLSLYSLREAFVSAAFDFDFVAIRSCYGGYAAVLARGDDVSVDQLFSVGQRLKGHGCSMRGEVFALQGDADVWGYLHRTTPVDRQRTRRVFGEL